MATIDEPVFEQAQDRLADEFQAVTHRAHPTREDALAFIVGEFVSETEFKEHAVFIATRSGGLERQMGWCWNCGGSGVRCCEFGADPVPERLAVCADCGSDFVDLVDERVLCNEPNCPSKDEV